MTRRYLVMFLYFPLSNPDIPRIASKFKSSLQRTFETLPILSGTVQPAPQSKQNGSLCVGAPWNNIDDVFRVNDLTSSDIDYANLRQNHFPMTTSDQHNLLSVLISRPDPLGVENPVMMAQVNFIRNGMILVPILHHAFMDGLGGATVMEMWATFFRGEDGAEMVSSGMIDRERLMFGDEAGRLEDFPEYVNGSATGSGNTPSAPQPPEPVETEVFFFPRSKIATLKSIVSASIASAGPNPSDSETASYISTNDALSALLFTFVTEARRPFNSTDTQQMIPFGLAVSARRLLNPPLPEPYIGNAILYCHVDVSLHSITTESRNIATIAHQIRKRLLQLDDNYVQRLIGALRTVDDITKVRPACRVSEEWRFVVTSWTTQTYYSMDWGSEIGSKCERIRMPKMSWPAFDGLMIVLPELKVENGIGEEEAGLEVMIGLKKGAMQRLKGMEEWTEWAQWRCS